MFSILQRQNRSFSPQISAAFLLKNLKIVACLTTVWKLLTFVILLSIIIHRTSPTEQIHRKISPILLRLPLSLPSQMQHFAFVPIEQQFFHTLSPLCQLLWVLSFNKTWLAKFLSIFFFLTQNKNSKWKHPCVFENLGNLKGWRQFYLWNYTKHSFKTTNFILTSLLELSLSNSCILSDIRFPKFSEQTGSRNPWKYKFSMALLPREWCFKFVLYFFLQMHKNSIKHKKNLN